MRKTKKRQKCRFLVLDLSVFIATLTFKTANQAE